MSTSGSILVSAIGIHFFIVNALKRHDSTLLMDEKTRLPAGSPILDDENFSKVAAFSGQVAHDINNLLTPLLAYPQLIRMELPPNGAGKDMLNTMEVMSKNIAHLASQLLVLSARTRNSSEIIDLSNVVNHSLLRIQSEYEMDQITLNLDLGNTPLLAKCDGEQISEALYNLLNNAVDAVGDQGVITIQMSAISNPENSLNPNARYQGNYARITVSDTGPGIPAEMKDHLFSPFFTTKKDNPHCRGAGLGLSIVYSVMKRHGGFVELNSADGKGAQAQIYIPIINENIPSANDQIPDEQPSCVQLAPRNRNRIMVVDDEKTILKLFQLMIKSALSDFEVDIAENGAEALGLFKSHHHAVIVMDLHMPVMDGQMAFVEIEKLCAEREWEMPPVIFCTGYAPPETVHKAVSLGSFHCLLQKPVRGDALVEAIKKRLPA